MISMGRRNGKGKGIRKDVERVRVREQIGVSREATEQASGTRQQATINLDDSSRSMVR